MERGTRVFVTIFVLVVLIAGLYIFSDWFSKATGYALGEDQKIAFAQCLTRNGAVLYITPQCADCDKQRALFGEAAYVFLTVRVCDSSNKCTGLSSLPAWEVEGKFYSGMHTFDQLDRVSSCTLNSPNSGN